MKPTKTWSLRLRQKADLLENILYHRGLQSELEVAAFLNPPEPRIFVDDSRSDLGIEPGSLVKALAVIRTAVENDLPIIIHGDYDVDGIVATAILWKTIYRNLGFRRCLPFIPNRFEHGYGLSKESIDEAVNLIASRFKLFPQSNQEKALIKPLLVTVDCGATAFEAVDYAQSRGFEVLVVDHHAKPEKLPDCPLVWTDKLCAAGIAWVLGELLSDQVANLDLVALATIADLQPLLGPNRSLVKYGLAQLNRTQNLGLKTLIKSAGIKASKIGTFEVGWILAPRLNASGRLTNALQSLRLLCTADERQASEISANLAKLNAERQALTQQALELAASLGKEGEEKNIKVVVHPEFHEGVIGLVAGRLVQEKGAPTVVISQGQEFSKASARSVNGFNIVDFLRSLGDHFEDIGGHAGAAGFTIRTERIEEFLQAINAREADLNLPKRPLLIDAEVGFEELDLALLDRIRQLEPFGLGNPEPVFLLKGVNVVEARTVGSQNQHLKLKISPPSGELVSSPLPLNSNTIDCIGFGLGERSKEVLPGNLLDLVFSLGEDSFSGRAKPSLKVKDFRSLKGET